MSSQSNRASVSVDEVYRWGLKPLEGDREPGREKEDLTYLTFLSTSADNKDGGIEGEKKQGKELAEAALEAGVKHFIYSSFVHSLFPASSPHLPSPS